MGLSGSSMSDYKIYVLGCVELKDLRSHVGKYDWSTILFAKMPEGLTP